jgi:hypothetical protein
MQEEIMDDESREFVKFVKSIQQRKEQEKQEVQFHLGSRNET